MPEEDLMVILPHVASGCGEPAPVWLVSLTFFLLVICIFIVVLMAVSIWRDLFKGK